MKNSVQWKEEKLINTGRFVAAAGGIWIVRVALNATFYSQIVGGQFEQIASAHPDLFQRVIPAFIVADLLFALVFACLFVKVGGALGGGIRGGVVLTEG